MTLDPKSNLLEILRATQSLMQYFEERDGDRAECLVELRRCMQRTIAELAGMEDSEEAAEQKISPAGIGGNETPVF